MEEVTTGEHRVYGRAGALPVTNRKRSKSNKPGKIKPGREEVSYGSSWGSGTEDRLFLSPEPPQLLQWNDRYPQALRFVHGHLCKSITCGMLLIVCPLFSACQARSLFCQCAECPQLFLPLTVADGVLSLMGGRAVHPWTPPR